MNGIEKHDAMDRIKPIGCFNVNWNTNDNRIQLTRTK